MGLLHHHLAKSVSMFPGKDADENVAHYTLCNTVLLKPPGRNLSSLTG